ncbi:arylamine N-acetyltransferase [Streptomyces uncialis]|uniref:arylamine N-acetyltransferase family protein n=1 Tax=Streptomyces uncialis TaxID=1048205 RepID=UPI002E30E2D7|nr:arylamine N-acetyltransferase [Streptomyces uncialis]WTE09645.1 arylamine N-acetyltransferase [Streptomyces uncialis]
MELDLDAYFDRIGWTGGRAPTADTLRALNRAHVRGIPFENLEPVLVSAPSIDLADIQTKLVRSRRGGYCYEQNTLFAAVLRALGFSVTGLAARVVQGARPGAIRPRTHMTLLVEVPDEPGRYLADVGFGSEGGLLEAVPLVVGTVTVGADGRRHRLVQPERTGPLATWLLQAREVGAPETADWDGQYSFTEEPFEQTDFDVANWHVATNPRSPFSRAVHVQRTFDDRHLRLAGRELTEKFADGRERRVVQVADEELLKVLADDFGIELPEGTKLP